ncbi:YvcK family protein [Patescibacteria group bacterium]|nr:YvcK family protein [Patescibacteria group bacterium]
MKKIVTIGGGTGSFVLLRGLREYPYDITAVVTMFDSGGSSGVLRDEHGVLPPGDIRRCLVALSSGEKEETLRQLFSYRFENGYSLMGHNFGNILLTALTEIFENEETAIREAGKLLNIKGTVLPVTLEKAHLCVELEDTTIIEGETHIDIPRHDGNMLIKRAFLRPKVRAYEEVEKAIEEADIIIIGPGDLYTSLIPNLIVKGVTEAIQKSKAQKIYIMNLMTKWGETNDFMASDCARVVLEYLGLAKFDYTICNDSKMPKKLLEKYVAEKKYPVLIDSDLEEYTNKNINADIYSGENILRHDSKKLAKVIVSILK